MESFKIISEIEKSHINSLVKKNQRIDGRDFLEYRKISLETGVILKAEGSARVRIGKTEIIAGIKISLGPPFPDTPDRGVITVNAELTALASPVFEPGPPNENSVEVARVVDRGIRHSVIVDYSKLCLIPGKQVFIIFIDLYVMSYDGNMFDAGTLAAVAALLSTKMPRTKIVDDEVVVLGEQYDKSDWLSLPFTNKAVSVTTAKIGDKLLIDPNEQEDRIMDARLTVTVDKSGNICSIQKGRKGFFTKDEILKCIEITLKKSKELLQYLP
ncbi:MAG: exosome complex protein Rrp42 [Candidatus Helarchaeota archaeon]|nr:exosome complex protein Rrp42 [Candidatus Helarchaeota archaeon]